MERRRNIVILYRSVCQRSSDFESRHLRLRTISLRPYKDSVSTPFFPNAPTRAKAPPPSLSSSRLKTPHPQLQSPHLPTLRTRSLKHLHPSHHPYSTNKTPQIPTPLPPPLPPNSYPPSPRAAISTRSVEPIPCTPAPHILRYPRGRTLRVPATQRLPQPTAYREPYETLSMLGVVYTCVHSCVHACIVMYTRMYNRAFIPISF